MQQSQQFALLRYVLVLIKPIKLITRIPTQTCCSLRTLLHYHRANTSLIVLEKKVLVQFM